MRSILFGVILGAVLSILFLFLGDHLARQDAIPTIIFVSIIGGAANFGIDSLKSYIRIKYGASRLLNTAALFLFLLVVIIAFLLAHLGLF